MHRKLRFVHLGKRNCIQNGDRTFLLSGVQVRIGIPGDLDVGVTEAACDLLDIDAVIDKHGGVRVAEIVDPDLWETGRICESGFVGADG